MSSEKHEKKLLEKGFSFGSQVAKFEFGLFKKNVWTLYIRAWNSMNLIDISKSKHSWMKFFTFEFPDSEVTQNTRSNFVQIPVSSLGWKHSSLTSKMTFRN